MKKKLFLISCFMILFSVVYGQNHWTLDTPIPPYNMSALVFISVEGEEQMRTDLEIAAFCDGKVRGVDAEGESFNINGVEHMLYIITIQGERNGEEITFKLYDPVSQKELLSSGDPIPFAKDSWIGFENGDFNPMIIDFYNVYWEEYEPNTAYDLTMTVTAKIQIDGVEQKRTNLEIAAFCGDELRGPSSRPVQYDEEYLVDMFVCGDGLETEPITFRLYDHGGDSDDVLISEYTVDFVGDAIIGLPEPVVMNFLTPYIAKIGETKYETLQAAVDAYNEGETITMIKNAQSEDAATINKNVAIDFAGFTYDGALDLNATLNVVGTAGKVTSIVLNEGAQVYHSYALETTIVRNIAGTASGWGTLSAPTATGNVVFNTTGRHDFYKYEESADFEWVFVDVEENAYTMQPGRGYLYANKKDVVASFTGALNMAAVKYVLSCTDKETDKELSGLNMIGNPFTHNINVNHLDGEIAEAFYSVATNGAWVPNVEESIAPLQAVLVQTDAKGTLTIKKTATRERGVSEGSLKINVANKNYNDVAYVLFKEGLGLSKIAHFNTEIPMVSVSVEGKEYAVATMNKEVTEIPVSFKAMTMGEYTISVEAQDVEETIYLTDKLTGERVNLNTDSYTFMATSNDNTDRFVLTKVLDTTGIEQNAEYSVYVSNDEIRFNNVNGNLNVRIYDMLGRPVAEYNVFESATISTSSFETGMYILQMTDENGVRTQKVLVD